MQIGFISCCVLSCHFDCFASFVVKLRGYIHYQIQRRELKASGPCSSPQCDLIQLRKDLTHLKARQSCCQGDGGKRKHQCWQRGRLSCLLPSTGPSSRWEHCFPGSCYWSSWSFRTEFPREALYLMTFFCVGIIYSTSPSDAYRIFDQSFEVAVFCFAPVIKSQY